MIRTFKALGLALFAILAMGAFMASAAQAQGVFTNTEATELTFTQDDENGTKPETGLQQFTTTSGSVQCKGLHGETKGLVVNSTLTKVTAEKLVATECQGPLKETATVEFNKCDYLLTAETTIGTTGMEVTGKAHISCLESSQITVTGAGGFCQIHVPAQEPGGHVIAHTNTGTKNDVTIEATVTGIKYQGTGLCTSGTEGQYKGNVTVKGFKKTPHEAAQETSIEVH